MGRIVDLCTEIAAVVEEGPEGLILPLQAREQFLKNWPDEDIDDALNFVTESMLQSELVEATDSLSVRLLDLLGTYGEEKAFAEAVAGGAKIDVGMLRQVAHRLDRVEEILDVFREEAAPDRQGFDALQARLLDQGIEDDMRPEWDPEEHRPSNDDEPDELDG